MSLSLSDMSDDEALAAGRIVASELLVRSLLNAGFSESDADNRIVDMASQLDALSPEILEPQVLADIIGQLKQALEGFLAGADSYLRKLTEKALEIAAGGATTVADKGGKPNWIISAGFAISLLATVSQTSFTADIGSLHIEKHAGVPVEIVEIVRAVVEAVPNGVEKKDPGADSENSRDD